MINYIPAEEHENGTTYQREDERDMNIYEDIRLVGEFKIQDDLHYATLFVFFIYNNLKIHSLDFKW